MPVVMLALAGAVVLFGLPETLGYLLAFAPVVGVLAVAISYLFD